MFLSKLDSLQTAKKLISDNQKFTEVEEISIYDAHKRVLAEDIMAFHDSPPFDKSAMDGFAVIGENTFGAGQSSPKEFKIIDAAKLIIQKTNSKSEIIYKDLPLDDPKIRKPDTTKAKNLLNWQAHTALNDGLNCTIKYFKEVLR